MSGAYQNIRRDLEDVPVFAGGKPDDAVTHDVHVPAPNFAAIGARSGMSLTAVAGSMSVEVAAFRGPEKGRQQPDGLAGCGRRLRSDVRLRSTRKAT